MGRLLTWGIIEAMYSPKIPIKIKMIPIRKNKEIASGAIPNGIDCHQISLAMKKNSPISRLIAPKNTPKKDAIRIGIKE